MFIFPISSVTKIHTMSPSTFLYLPSSLFPSLRMVGPLFSSQGGQLALHQTRLRTKGKLQIVVVRAATRGNARRYSGCLWLALITDEQPNQALESPAGAKKTQDWFRQKNTD